MAEADVLEPPKLEKKKVVLPTQKNTTVKLSPGSMIIISKPKIGKTEVAAGLENNLILDFEAGTDFVRSMKLPVGSMEELAEICKAIKDANFPYDYVTVDTATSMEEMCAVYAEKLYSQTPMGKYWYVGNTKENLPSQKSVYRSILNLPEGLGYYYLRASWIIAFDFINKLAPRRIFMCHIRDAQLIKDDITVMSSDIDLTGKIKRMATSYVDAIGYMRRKGNQNIISFKPSQDMSCGARSEHLQDKDIVISEKKDGVVTTYWDRIFID